MQSRSLADQGAAAPLLTGAVRRRAGLSGRGARGRPVTRTPRPRARRNKGSVTRLLERRRSPGNRPLPLYPGASAGWGGV